MDKQITVQWQADSRLQPLLAQLIGTTVAWTSGLDSGSATINECRLAGFDSQGLATFEMYLAVTPSN
ncbi:MAG TPA: hypothetical protein VF157_16515 [Chloroflexota bacterium]